MSRTLSAMFRRANRLLRPAKTARATRSIQKAMTSLVIKTALGPLVAVTPKPKKPRRTKAPKVGRTLDAVLRQLRTARTLMPRGLPAAARREASPRIPEGAQYLARRHRTPAGSRGYRLYLPASQPQQPRGLILMLHGCNQTPDDFAIGTNMNALAEKHGLAIAYPAQTGVHNGASCWNWFKPGHQARGAGEPAILASLARKLMKEHGLRRDAVFVAGLSAGGAMAAVLADVYPDVFSAAGIHSGLARGAAGDVISAMSAMRNGGSTGALHAVATPSQRVRRIVFHGDADSTVHPSNATAIVEAAVKDAMPTMTSRRSVRGRGYARNEYAGVEGVTELELWMVEGAGHAWSGGRAAGSYTETKGPDASAQMVRFFLAKSA